MHHLIASIMGRKLSEDRQKKVKAEQAAEDRAANRGDEKAGNGDSSGEDPDKPAD